MIQYSGADYLRIEIAGNFGLDKLQFEERIEWVNEHEHELESLEDVADDFFQYAASVMAYRKAQQGIPSGYLCGLDACASGPAILSALTGCKVGAANTGLTGDKRMDVYGICTDVMKDTLDGDMGEYTRTEVKDSFMPHFYLSKREPELVFGKDSKELSAFLSATWTICPGASMFLQLIKTMWDPEALQYTYDYPDGFKVIKKVTDTVEDKVEVDTLPNHPTFNYRHTINTTLEKGLFLAADIVQGADGYVVRELTARCDHDKGKLRSAEIELVRRLKKDLSVSPEAYLYCERMWRKHEALSIEGSECVTYWSVNQMSKEYCQALLELIRETLRRPCFKVVCIHDCFKSLPNYMNWVRQTYIDLMAEIADSRMLDAILSDIAQQPIHVEKLSDDLSALIRAGDYAIA